MENEILENGATPEAEEVVETVETVETAAVESAVEETAPVAEQTSFVDTAKNIATDVLAKGKELVSDPKAAVEKIKAVPAKIWAFIGGGIAALIAIIIVLSALGNTYKTPIKAVEKLLNSKSVSQVLNRAPAVLNGFGEKEAKDLINIAKKTDQYKDYEETIEEYFDMAIEYAEENIGKNYKISLKVTDKDKMKKDELKSVRENLRAIGKMAAQLDDVDDDVYADVAEDLGISKGQVKKAVKLAKNFCKDCKGAKVKKGYKLTIEVKITGKELDEPMEMELPVTINVVKVDGRWIIDVFSLADTAEDLLGGMDLDDLMMMAAMAGMGGSSGMGSMSGMPSVDGLF